MRDFHVSVLVRAAGVVVSIALVAPQHAALAHGPSHEEIAEIDARQGEGSASARDILHRGELYRSIGAWSAAAADYDRAATLEPSLAGVDVCRAALALDLRDPAGAAGVLDGVLGKDPDHADALRLRARARLLLGRPLEAAVDLDRRIAGAAAPSPEDYLMRAEALARCGATDRALKGLDQGIARLGPVVSLELRALELEVRRRNFDAALDRLERLATRLALPNLLERRGRILELAGRPQDARAARAAALAEIESTPRSRRLTAAMRAQEVRLRAAEDRE